MSMLPDVLKSFSSLLNKPGDKLTAEISPTGKQIVRIATEELTTTLVRYSTGKVVQTIVYDPNK